VTDSHDVLRHLGIEAGDRTIQVRHLVADHHRHRQGRRTVNPEDFSSRELTTLDHFIETRFRVANDLVVLGRLAEANLEDAAIDERDVVGGHGNELHIMDLQKQLYHIFLILSIVIVTIVYILF